MFLQYFGSNECSLVEQKRLLLIPNFCCVCWSSLLFIVYAEHPMNEQDELSLNALFHLEKSRMLKVRSVVSMLNELVSDCIQTASRTCLTFDPLTGPDRWIWTKSRWWPLRAPSSRLSIWPCVCEPETRLWTGAASWTPSQTADRCLRIWVLAARPERKRTRMKVCPVSLWVLRLLQRLLEERPRVPSPASPARYGNPGATWLEVKRRRRLRARLWRRRPRRTAEPLQRPDQVNMTDKPFWFWSSDGSVRAMDATQQTWLIQIFFWKKRCILSMAGRSIFEEFRCKRHFENVHFYQAPMCWFSSLISL